MCDLKYSYGALISTSRGFSDVDMIRISLQLMLYVIVGARVAKAFEDGSKICSLFRLSIRLRV